MSHVIIIPAGDEICDGILLDTNSPAIARLLQGSDAACVIDFAPPCRDSVAAITSALSVALSRQPDWVIFTGGTGGGGRHAPELAPDRTSTAVIAHFASAHNVEIHGSNGHLFSNIVVAGTDSTTVVTLPGPHAEALAGASVVAKYVHGRSADHAKLCEQIADAIVDAYPHPAPVDSFLFSSRTREGHAFALGGIVQGPSRVHDDIRRAFEQLSLGETRHPVSLDEQLASTARESCGEEVLALGVTISVPGIPGPAGGILGDPHCDAHADHDCSVTLRQGLSLATRPGGPGIVIAGDPGTAESLLQSVAGEATGAGKAHRLCELARERGVLLAMAVTDGSDNSEPGQVATLDRGGVLVQRLPQPPESGR